MNFACGNLCVAGENSERCLKTPGFRGMPRTRERTFFTTHFHHEFAPRVDTRFATESVTSAKRPSALESLQVGNLPRCPHRGRMARIAAKRRWNATRATTSPSMPISGSSYEAMSASVKMNEASPPDERHKFKYHCDRWHHISANRCAPGSE